MNDPYKIVLAAVRFVAALNLVAGASSLLALVLILAISLLPIHGPDMSGWLVMILFYGILYIVIGVGFLVCARGLRALRCGR